MLKDQATTAPPCLSPWPEGLCASGLSDCAPLWKRENDFLQFSMSARLVTIHQPNPKLRARTRASKPFGSGGPVGQRPRLHPVGSSSPNPNGGVSRQAKPSRRAVVPGPRVIAGAVEAPRVIKRKQAICCCPWRLLGWAAPFVLLLAILVKVQLHGAGVLRPAAGRAQFYREFSACHQNYRNQWRPDPPIRILHALLAKQSPRTFRRVPRKTSNSRPISAHHGHRPVLRRFQP